jgi:hypothetical protein
VYERMIRALGLVWECPDDATVNVVGYRCGGCGSSHEVATLAARCHDWAPQIRSRSRPDWSERLGTRTRSCSSAISTTAIRTTGTHWLGATSRSLDTSAAATPQTMNPTTSNRSPRSAC